MRMLDNVIDLNFYPTEESKKANLAHRPVGAGTMGWADIFHSYQVNFSSEEAVKFSDELYEFISYNCIFNFQFINWNIFPFRGEAGRTANRDRRK